MCVLNAGNIIGQKIKATDGGTITRSPSGIMINFGQQVDLLKEIMRIEIY